LGRTADRRDVTRRKGRTVSRRIVGERTSGSITTAPEGRVTLRVTTKGVKNYSSRMRIVSRISGPPNWFAAEEKIVSISDGLEGEASAKRNSIKSLRRRKVENATAGQSFDAPRENEPLSARGEVPWP